MVDAHHRGSVVSAHDGWLSREAELANGDRRDSRRDGT